MEQIPREIVHEYLEAVSERTALHRCCDRKGIYVKFFPDFKRFNKNPTQTLEQCEDTSTVKAVDLLRNKLYV